MTNTVKRPYSPAIAAMIDGFDGGDLWGSAMSMAFAVAQVADAANVEGTYTGLGEVSTILDYQASPYAAIPSVETLAEGLLDSDSDVQYDTAILADAYVNGRVSDDDLIRAARVLSRYVDWCKRAGLHY